MLQSSILLTWAIPSIFAVTDLGTCRKGSLLIAGVASSIDTIDYVHVYVVIIGARALIMRAHWLPWF